MWRLPSVLPAPWRRTDWAASLARWPPRRCCTSPATCAALHFPFWMLSKQNLKYEHPLKPFDTSHWSVSPYKPFDLIYTLFKVPDHQLICLAWVPGAQLITGGFPRKKQSQGFIPGLKALPVSWIKKFGVVHRSAHFHCCFDKDFTWKKVLYGEVGRYQLGPHLDCWLVQNWPRRQKLDEVGGQVGLGKTPPTWSQVKCPHIMSAAQGNNPDHCWLKGRYRQFWNLTFFLWDYNVLWRP